MFSRAVINALLPDGSAWEPEVDSDYDFLLNGVGENSDAIYADLNLLRYLRDPSRTPILSDLELEYGVIPVPLSTEAERRERLAVVMYRRSELPTYELLEEKLRAAGFDVYVHANDPPVDPAQFLDQAFQMTCDDLLPDGNPAECGEAEAYCGQVGGELLVNGELFEQLPNYLILCDEALAQCGEADALCGNFDEITMIPIEYEIPESDGYWGMIFFVGGEATRADVIFDWTPAEAAAANQWWGITYGDGVFVAVSLGGVNRTMWSDDNALTWNPVVATEQNVWRSVAYGNGVFVAVADSGVNRTMWSDDNGQTWNAVAATELNSWNDIAYGNGVFVAVSRDGVNRTMWSDDNGLTWNAVAAAAVMTWGAIGYGDGVFVAVSSGMANATMWSDDNGQTWNAVAATEANAWRGVAYGDGVFIAVSSTGVNRTMWSDDNGQTWNAVAVEANSWSDIAYGDGVFVAVSFDGANRTMWSDDNGLTWNPVIAAEPNAWHSAIFGNEIFVAVSSDGVNRVMWSRMAGGITNIDIAEIPIERRLEFRRIILKYKPMASWAGLVVVYT